MIDGCDTGVEDTDGIQDGIDACEADARNHGQFVRCVALFTRSEGMSQADRRPVMKCASQSSIGKPGSVPASSSNAAEPVVAAPAVSTASARTDWRERLRSRRASSSSRDAVKTEPVNAAPAVSTASARADRRERLRERIAAFRAKYGR